METLKVLAGKSYTTVQIHRENWSEIHTETQIHLKSLSSYCEQLECVLKTQPCELVMKFPDLRCKLEMLLLTLIENEIIEIQSSLENFSLCNQKLKNTFEVLNNLYLEQFSVVHSDEAFYQGTHLIPSLSEMMEWADDINIYYTTWLIKAKHFLEVFDNSSESVSKLQSTLDSMKTSDSVDSIISRMSIFCSDN